MAEVVGLAASIIQIGGAGTKLSIELYNFISTAARADSEITNIAGDVKLTSKVLGDVGKVLVSDDAKKLVNQDAIQHAKELIRQCEEVFNELSDVVEKGRKPGTDGKSRVSFRAKMGWPMKEQRVELLRRRLETLKSSLLVLFYVLQLAHDKARGDVEAAALEEQRKQIRELYQQQQDSLRILKALERKICVDKAVDGGPSQDPNAPVPSSPGSLTISTAAPPVSTAHEQVKGNDYAMCLFKNLGPDTSDSEAITTDDEGEHLTLDELAECATQVQKLLRRIMTLQEILKSGIAVDHHRKRRMHKVYQRFCRKFEANIVDVTLAPPEKTSASNKDCIQPVTISHVVPPALVTSTRPGRQPRSRRVSHGPHRPTRQRRSSISYTPPKQEDDRLVGECTVPGCNKCGPDAASTRQSRRQSMLPTKTAESAPAVYDPDPYDTYSQVSDTAQYQALSSMSNRQPQLYRTQAEPVVQPSVSRRRSVNNRPERLSRYHELSRPSSNVSKSRSSSYIGTPDYSGSQLSSRESRVGAPNEHGPSPSRLAYGSIASTRRFQTMPYEPPSGALPVAFYEAQQMRPMHDQQRPSLQARASQTSAYGYPLPPPVVQVERSDRNMPSASYRSKAPPQATVQRRQPRVEYRYEGHDDSWSKSESETESEEDYELEHRDQGTCNVKEPLQAEFLSKVAPERRLSLRHAKTTPASHEVSRRRPQTIVMQRDRQREREARSTRLSPSTKSQLTCDTPQGRVPVVGPRNSRRRSNREAHYDAFSRRGQSTRLHSDSVELEFEREHPDDNSNEEGPTARLPLRRRDKQAENRNRSQRNLETKQDSSAAENQKLDSLDELLLGKGEERSPEEEEAEARKYAEMARFDRLENLLISQQEAHVDKKRDKVADAKGAPQEKPKSADRGGSLGEKEGLPLDTPPTVGDGALVNFDFDRFLHVDASDDLMEAPPSDDRDVSRYQEEMMALERQSKKRSTEALELPQKTRYILSIAACRPTQATAEDYFSDDSFEVRSVSPMSPMANVGTKRSDSDNKALVGSHADYGSIRGLQPANSMDNRGSSVAALVPRPTYWERYQLGLREDKFGTPEGVATDKETFGKLIRAPSEPTQSSSYEDRCHRRRRKCENSERSESRTELESAAHRKQQRSDKEKYKLKSRVTSSRSGCNNVADWPERISVSPAVTSIGSEPANTNSASKRRRTEVAISDGSVRKEQRDIVDVLLEQWTMPMSK